MIIRFLYPYRILVSALFCVFALPTVASPTQAQISPRVNTVQIALTAAEEKIMKEKAAQVVELLNRGEYAKVRELLAPTLASQLTADEIKEIWENSFAQTGKVKKQVSSQVIDTINSDLVIIETEFERTTDNIIITFNEDEQIVGIDFPKLETVTEISQKVVNFLAQNNFTRARSYLHPLLKTEIFPQQIQQKWEQIERNQGAFKRIVETDVRAGSSVDEADVVLLTLEFEKSTQQLLIIFDDQRRIVGINPVE